MSPGDILRRNEMAYRCKNLQNLNLTDLEIILNFPKLIQRPIVSNGDKDIAARPPEKIFAII